MAIGKKKYVVIDSKDDSYVEMWVFFEDGDILDDVKKGGEQIYLNAQEYAVGFYEKYGFIKQGKPFLEANIVHYKMNYTEKSLNC